MYNADAYNMPVIELLMSLKESDRGSEALDSMKLEIIEAVLRAETKRFAASSDTFELEAPQVDTGRRHIVNDLLG